jgi:four helix bundle protein
MEKQGKSENVIVEKTYQFAINAIEVYKNLVGIKREFILSKQFLRSATSIGANVEEAIGAQSKKDFIAKLSISYKEAREVNYWIRLLRDSNFLETSNANELLEGSEEILRILTAILKSSKNKN